MHVCLHVCVYLLYIHVCECKRVCLHVCVYVSMCVCVFTVWVTKKYTFFVKQRPCNGNFALRFRARSVLHISVFIFAAWTKLFYVRGTVKETVKRTLYVHKAEARKLLIGKELPISKNGDGV